jgi:hypothetical protein
MPKLLPAIITQALGFFRNLEEVDAVPASQSDIYSCPFPAVLCPVWTRSMEVEPCPRIFQPPAAAAGVPMRGIATFRAPHPAAVPGPRRLGRKTNQRPSWMYLVAILDWFSRFVVAWELDQTLEMPFVLKAVDRALGHARPVI